MGMQIMDYADVNRRENIDRLLRETGLPHWMNGVAYKEIKTLPGWKTVCACMRGLHVVVWRGPINASFDHPDGTVPHNDGLKEPDGTRSPSWKAYTHIIASPGDPAIFEFIRAQT
jgi:hypothetical protein